MANFLARLKILLADPKIDAGSLSVELRLAPLFRTVASKWKRCNIRPVYLEKVVSMCKDYNAADVSGGKAGEKGPSKAAGKTASKALKNAPNSHHSAAVKDEDGKHVTSQLLSACLDLFIVLAEEAPDNKFLSENSSQLNEILTCCFLFARQRDEHEIRDKLQRFVVRFLSSGNTQIDEKVVRTINVLLEKFLIDAEMEYRNSPSAGPTSPEQSRQGSSRPRQASSEEERMEEFIATFALEIIKEVDGIRRSFFKAFSSSLLTLLATLIKKHTTAASAKQKQGGVSYVPQAGTCSIRQMHHTPVSGILAESCSMENSQLATTGTSRSLQAREPYPSKELKEFDQTLRCAVIALEILGRSDLPYSFTQSRKTLFQTISSILESSNNVQLIMSAVRVVGKWLLSDMSGGPLTVKERNSFLWKIASFDFNGLPDVVSQPLADLVSHYVITLLCGKKTKAPQGIALIDVSRSGESQSSSVPQRFSDDDDIIIERSLVACLLTANHSLRDTLLSLFVSQTSDVEQEQASISPAGEIPIRAPVELLWQLFHSDFEGLGGRNWVVLFVELLLTSIRPMPPRDCGSNDGDNSPGIKRYLPSPISQANKNASLPNDSKLVGEYQGFCEALLREESDLAAGGLRFRTALRRLAHGDVTICQNLFDTLLPAAWDSVPNDGVRLRLVPAMESLLCRPFHSQFLKSGGRRDEQRAINAIRSFLNGLAKLNPLPALDVDLLVSLSETHNCWYEVLSILEDQFVVLSSKGLSTVGCGLKDKTLLAMRHCYRQLGEPNIWTSLALESCSLDETKRAASLDVHGKVDEALEAYTSLVELVESGRVSPTDFEMDMLEERWVELNREQCQLAVVSEYANTSENSRLMLECAWKQRDWDRVRSLCSSSSLVAAVESGEPAVKMCETLLAVADGKLSEVENLHAQTAQLCLYKWQLLPDLSCASLAHASLLHFFHRLVEIRESGQIMVETSNHSNGKTLPDLKNLLK
jgi:hypothetical protein